MYRIKDRINLNTQEYMNDFYKNYFNDNIAERRNSLYEEVLEWLSGGRISVLDVGCGTGYGLAYIRDRKPDIDLYGCDFSDYAIVEARKRYENITFFEHNIVNDDLNDRYDYMLLLQTLEHLEDPMFVINKLLKCCTYLIVSVPFEDCLKKDIGHIYSGFTEGSFKDFDLCESKIIERGKPSKIRKNLYVKLRGAIKK